MLGDVENRDASLRAVECVRNAELSGMKTVFLAALQAFMSDVFDIGAQPFNLCDDVSRRGMGKTLKLTRRGGSNDDLPVAITNGVRGAV